MTNVDQAARIRSAGFEFARQLRHAEFRKLLDDSGWKSGQHIIIATDDERVVDVVSRMITHEAGQAVLIAMPRSVEPFGFSLLMVKLVKPRLFNKVKPIALGPGASIGMLYEAVTPCGTYVPHAWTQELMFEKIDGTTGH